MYNNFVVFLLFILILNYFKFFFSISLIKYTNLEKIRYSCNYFDETKIRFKEVKNYKVGILLHIAHPDKEKLKI